MSKEIQHYADAAMFDAAPMESEGISVHLLWMTPDPLGAIAAACRMYEGYPTYDLADITDEERKKYFEQVQKTHLKAPLEFVKFHFFLEGVDRAFTHQMVRQRTAVYAQESLRFAVKDNLPDATTLPPSLPAGSDLEDRWKKHMETVEGFYDYLIANGIPAEDARGVLPIATKTRLNYATDLRALLDHAGNRLCTQAQFHWRIVFAKIREEIRQFEQPGPDGYVTGFPSWQMEKISQLFMPVCYQMGKCPFKADFDRGCTIRERVDLFSEHGIKPEDWGKDHVLIGNDVATELTSDEKIVAREFGPDPEGLPFYPGIRTEEWLADPQAGRVKVGDKYGDQTRRR